ncbi:hypothetical protein COW53_08480 [bacterium CG17_big_fil_post_rev_8_21_14_2_50_64_8]|nr:MAG: hypothetical protein COW53_08480 [bacterium CG17_big_fil_post_rev_8_21_14_2_50_64_8]PJA73886.1 MAG: hypothetical protein CO151_10880 [bacterium CG_4_9_14_3_um_filter_65_15]
MKSLHPAVLLLLLAITATVAAGDAPVNRQVNRELHEAAKGAPLNLADLVFALNPRLGLGFPSQNVDNYYVFPLCGMGLVRLTLLWSNYEPSRGQYDWSGLDNKVRVLQDLGIDIFMTLQSDADWGVEPSDFLAANHPPADMADWTTFMTHLVQRYNGDGVDDLPGLLRPVRYYQLANEWPSPQNIHGGWTGTIDQLIEFFNASYAAVKAADPSATVVLGGIPSIGLDAMVLNAGQGNYVARQSYNETVKDSLTVAIAQDPRIAEAVAVRERVLAESLYDMVDLHMYGPVEFNQYRISRIRQNVGDVPLVSSECGGPNLAYDPVITPEEHFQTAMDMNLDALSRGLVYTMWLSMFGQEYVPGIGPTWGNSQLQPIDKNQQPTGGFWAYHLLAAMLDGMDSVEKPGPGIYIIHRYDQPNIHVAWRTDANTTYQLPSTVHAQKMIVVTSARLGTYQLEPVPANGLLQLTGPLPIVVSEILPGGVSGDSGPPHPTVALGQVCNFPNPFNPAMEIRFVLGEDSRVQVEIFNLRGQRIATLLDNELPAGPHGVVWHAGQQPSGTYFYRITAAGNITTGRCELVK